MYNARLRKEEKERIRKENVEYYASLRQTSNRDASGYRYPMLEVPNPQPSRIEEEEEEEEEEEVDDYVTEWDGDVEEDDDPLLKKTQA